MTPHPHRLTPHDIEDAAAGHWHEAPRPHWLDRLADHADSPRGRALARALVAGAIAAGWLVVGALLLTGA